MTQALCGCGRPSPSAVICRACSDRLGERLALAADLAADLDAAVARQVARGSGGRRRDDVQPLPYDPAAAEARAMLRAVLSGWVRVMQDTYARCGWRWPADDVPAMARWLAGRLEHVRRHPAADDVLAETSGAVRGVQRVIGWDPVQRQPHQPGPVGLASLALSAGLLGSPAQLADWLEALGVAVAESTISSWGTRGRIERLPGGMYRLADAYGVASRRVGG